MSSDRQQDCGCQITQGVFRALSIKDPATETAPPKNSCSANFQTRLKVACPCRDLSQYLLYKSNKLAFETPPTFSSDFFEGIARYYVVNQALFHFHSKLAIFFVMNHTSSPMPEFDKLLFHSYLYLLNIRQENERFRGFLKKFSKSIQNEVF